MKDADQHSYASLSALGGYTSQRVDVKKVQYINQNVQNFLSSKTPLETTLAILKTYKAALKNVARATIFILNRYLQAYVFKDMNEQRQHYKAI